MRRDIDYLADNHFDVVIIGGGIHGCVLFRQLAETGARVALLEKEDFGGGTSANSLKILHGGLRYLQHLNIKRIRDSVYSRKSFMQVAPELIQPLPCVIPTSGFGVKGKSVMAVALKLFDLLSWDRNQHAPEQNRTGRGNLLSKGQLLNIAPHLNSTQVTGGALWYDDLILNTERMSLAFVKAGCAAGGAAANYLKVGRLDRNKNRISGVEVTDQLSGRSFTVRGRMMINVAGPWTGEIPNDSSRTSSTEDLAKAINIVVDRQLFTGYGIGLESSDEVQDQDAKIKRSNRLFFFVPWKDRTIIGTSYSHYHGRCDELSVEEWEIEDIINEVNSIYPGAALDRDSVVNSHAGLLPAHKPEDATRNGTPQLLKSPKIIDHEKSEELSGLLTITGVKYTTAPAIALQVEKLLRKKSLIPAQGRKNGLGGFAADIPAEPGSHQLFHKYPHLRQSYGSYCTAIQNIIDHEPDGATLLCREVPLIQAEVLYAIREEMAMKLSDVILRRTDCGSNGCPPQHELVQVASFMAGELNWSENRQTQEIDQLRSYYHSRQGRQQ